MDDMYPNDGEYFAIPAEPMEQQRDRAEEKSKVNANKKPIEEIIARLNDRIEYYNTIDSISTDVMTKPEEFMRQWEVNKQTQVNLIMEKEYWEGLLKTHS